jgi:hypothetical protein
MDWLFDANLSSTTTTPAPTLPVTSSSTLFTKLPETTTTTRPEELGFAEFDPHYEFVSTIDFSELFPTSSTTTVVTTTVAETTTASLIEDYDAGIVDVVDVDTSDMGSGVGLVDFGEYLEEVVTIATTPAPFTTTTTELPVLTSEHVRISFSQLLF